MPNLSKEAFVTLATRATDLASAHQHPQQASMARSVSSEHPSPPEPTLAIPLSLRLLSDQLTPVLAYRRLVVTDQREAPSFLLESVEGGERQGRYSILGAQPIAEVIAHGPAVAVSPGTSLRSPSGSTMQSPFDTLRHLSEHLRLVPAPQLPRC